MSTQQKVFIALLSLYLSVPLFGNSQKIALVDYDEVQRGPILNKGAAWKMWNSIFTACMKSEMLKNPK